MGIVKNESVKPDVTQNNLNLNGNGNDHLSSVNTPRTIFNWSIQILLWICLLYMLVDLSNSDISLLNLFLTFFIYLIYLVNNLYFSATHSYLDNIVKHSNLRILMRKFFNSPIEKKFTIENWHWESDSFASGKDKRKKKVTSEDSELIKYKSWRDTSGSLLIDTKESQKLFLRLKMEFELDFEDNLAKSEYDQKISDFKKRNEGKDAEMDFKEKTVFNNFESYVLIKLNDESNFFLTSFVYFLCTTMIPIAEIYKYYFAKQCHYQEYKFKKTISFRNNLNSPEFDQVEKFKNSAPKVVIQNDEKNIDFLNGNKNSTSEVTLKINKSNAEELKEPLINK
jgi:hypothetical protein